MKYKGFKNENGDFVQEVFFDGYTFGDRLLEDVIFKARIKNGKVFVEITKDCAEYFKELNQKKWLKEAKEFVEGLDEGEEYLYDSNSFYCDLIKF